MRVRPIPVYYWRGAQNFGDRLTEPLLKRFTGLEAEWCSPGSIGSGAGGAMLVMIGSILEHLDPSWPGVIAGAGKLHEEPQAFPNAVVLGVRGKLTYRMLGSPSGSQGKGVVAGDPALLANELVKLEEKQYDLGLIPHWTDHELEFREDFLKYKPKVIRVSDPVLTVVREIGWCKRIVTSSLHGAIVADSFGIPRRIELAPLMKTDCAREGGVFKWLDYHSGIKTRFMPGVMMEADRNAVIDKQSELFDLYERVKDIFK